MTKEQFSAYMAGVTDSDGSFCLSKLHKNRENCTYQASYQLTWTANDLTSGVKRPKEITDKFEELWQFNKMLNAKNKPEKAHAHSSK